MLLLTSTYISIHQHINVELLRFNSTKSGYRPVGDCTLIATTAVVSVFTAVVAATDTTAAKITSNAATITTAGSDLGL